MDPNGKPQTLTETFDQAYYNSTTILSLSISNSHNFVDLSCAIIGGETKSGGQVYIEGYTI